MRTYSPKISEIKKEWHLIDADGEVLGRLAVKIAQLLMGKNKSYFVPYLDCGDYVVVVNAEKIKLTGDKKRKKVYYRHSGYPGGFKEITFQQQFAKDPTKIIYQAVSGMLPKNKLRDKRLARLKIFVGKKHKYEDKFLDKTKKLNSKDQKIKNE